MADKRLVRSEAFPGTIDRFRYLMDDLTGQYVKWWGNPNGVSLWIKEVEKKYSFCWAWGIVAYGPFVGDKRGKAIGVAGMEAEEVDGTTQIRFFDEYNPRKPMLEAPAIGPAFEEFCEMIVSEMRRWIEEHPEPARTEAGGEAADDRLDPVDRKIIEVVRQIESEGLRATDELVALRLPVLSPRTGEPYSRKTINTRRNKLRERGYEV